MTVYLNESRVRRDYSVKERYILVLAGAFVAVNFVFAEVITQPVSGGGGTDAASGNYSMKAAVADPGVGQSQSANYIYDHGTLWAAGTSTATTTPPPPIDVPIGGAGPGSGSGWDEWWDIEDPDLGISALTPEKSPVMEKVIEVVRTVASSDPDMGAVPVGDFGKKAIPWIVEKCPNGCVLAGVNSENGIQEVAVTLVKRVLPWPFWVVIALVVLGLLAFVAFGVGALSGHRVVYGAGAAIVVALIAGMWMRYHYRAAYKAMDFTSIVDARVVSPEQAESAVTAIAEELAIGGHKVTVLGSPSAPQMTITVYVKKALPI